MSDDARSETTKTLTAISARTVREWPADHPLRSESVLMSDEQIAECGAYLICAHAGDEAHLPPAPDDADEYCRCGCGLLLLRRRSSTKHLTPICWRCWVALTADGKSP